MRGSGGSVIEVRWFSEGSGGSVIEVRWFSDWGQVVQ